MKIVSTSALMIFVSGLSFAVVPEQSDTANTTQPKARRIYTTTRLTTEKPVIDGKFDDACWKTGEWAGDFIQWIPSEGAPPTYPTFLNILYDDRNIYVAIRAHDGEPEKIVRKADRRDQLRGDMVGVNFDSYHDHRTGFEFNVTAAGQKVDLLLTNPCVPDMNWNAVWFVETALDDSGWTAEFEIPLSQLRYSSDDEQIWGLHCWRWIDRLQEESDWEPQSSTGPGSLYLFGELHGLNGLPKSRRIEILPFTLGKLKTFPAEPGNPFAEDGRRWLGNAGLDAKIGLSSNFTADLTINPDFGQVESDPSVMNLTAFETFYEEKRPFFLEGKNIFGFDFDDVTMFYSRRIGHAPTYNPDLGDGEYMKMPDYTTILSAVKVSGKSADGLAVGVIQSLTNTEYATVGNPNSQREVAVEPLTSSTVARIQQDYGEGNTMLGGIVTATNRFLNDEHLDFVNRNAFTGGVDLQHHWNDKEFFVTAKLVGSTISGSAEAISSLQRASARYYQRPDVDYVHFDSTRTSLAGYGGQIKVGKGSKGLWRYSTQLDWRSPGLDLNDLGYMRTADIVKLTNALSYFVNQPVSIFRTYSVGVNETSNWDFGMRYLSTALGANVYLEFLNNWSLSLDVGYSPQALDPWILRGGYAMLVPSHWYAEAHAKTDQSRDLVIECEYGLSGGGSNSAHGAWLEPSVSVVPITQLRIAVSVEYSREVNNLQYVGAPPVNAAPLYMLARIEQQSLAATFRIDWSLTNDLSFQFYGSPFGAIGRYSSFKTVSDPRAGGYDERFLLLQPVANGGMYELYGGVPSAPYLTFGNPDFAFGQFRSVLVFRWEYSPGSQLYFVWSHERTSYQQPGGGSVGDVLRDLKSASGANIFLMKLSYWIAMH
jgi:hypothetical protein